jgi:hypothetical protein
MSLFDDYFDPGQFRDSGGLVGRMMSAHPEWGLPQAGADGNSQNSFGLRPAMDSQTPVQSAPSPVASAGTGVVAASGPVGDPTQYAGAANVSTSSASHLNDPSLSFSPDFGARLNAGFQRWAQTPTGSPFAALANGIAGFNGTQPASDATTMSNAAPPHDLSDRLGAAFQSWAQTPVGSPFAGLANGIAGFNTGQMSLSPAARTPAQSKFDGGDTMIALAQSPSLAAANPIAPQAFRQLAVIRKRPPSRLPR